MFVHNITDACASQGVAMTVKEQRPLPLLGSIQMLITLIGSQQLDRSRHQGDQSAFSSFACHADLGGRFKSHMDRFQINQFLNPDSGIIKQGEQSRIASSLQRVQAWLGQQLLHPFWRQVVHICLGWCAFTGNREYPLALQQTIRFHFLEISKEGMDSCQTLVSGCNGTMTMSLKIVKEIQDNFRRQGIEVQAMGRPTAPITAIDQQQREGSAVAFDSVGARVSLGRKVFA